MNLMQLLGFHGHDDPAGYASAGPQDLLAGLGYGDQANAAPQAAPPTSGLSDAWLSQALGQPAGDPQAAPQPALAPAANVLQALQGGPTPNASPVPQSPPAPAANPPRQRRSILDTIGRLSDVFAKVGGAAALYQPTLDARQDRVTQAAQRDRANAAQDLNNEQTRGAIAGDAMDNSAKAFGITGKAVQRANAYLTANPGADPAKVWGLFAQQAGVDPAHAQAIAGELANNPKALEAMSTAFDAGDEKSAKYGGNVIYGTDKSGKLVAYQPGIGAAGARSVLPDGVTPIDPLKFVDTGGSQVGVGTRSGTTSVILPKAQTPDTVANNATRRYVSDTGNASRERVAAAGNETKTTIAGMPARAKAGTGKDDGQVTAYHGAKQQISTIYAALTDLRNDPDLDKATGFIAGGIPSPAKKNIDGKIAKIKGMAVPAAVAILKAQGVQRPAQAEVLATAKGLISDLELTRQGTGNYRANIDGSRRLFMQKLQSLTEDATRTGTIKPAAPKPAGRPGGKPSVSNW